MRLNIRSIPRAIAQSLRERLTAMTRGNGRHAAAIGSDEPWLPSTPVLAAPVPELHHPRVPRYVETKPACSEWLSREYAILYQWVAEMELSIYASDLRARSYVCAAA